MKGKMKNEKEDSDQEEPFEIEESEDNNDFWESEVEENEELD